MTWQCKVTRSLRSISGDLMRTARARQLPRVRKTTRGTALVYSLLRRGVLGKLVCAAVRRSVIEGACGKMTTREAARVWQGMPHNNPDLHRIFPGNCGF